MVPFTYARSSSVASAVQTGALHISSQSEEPGTAFFAGGTDMVQLMREQVLNPSHVVDVSALPGISDIVAGPAGATLGALVRMSDAAEHPGVREHYPVIAEALLASASPQVRNLATLGGNLLQRTRCGYFRDVASPCNKRQPGSGCPAINGQNRLHAVLGTSEHCIATYAGDLANALLVLDAKIRIAGSRGERQIALRDLHKQPHDTPHLETQLAPGELILAIEIPSGAAARKSHYLKVRDRATFEWSIASVAVALDLDSFGVVRDVRLAVGGVATTPWRLPEVEEALHGHVLDSGLCRHAAELATRNAVSHGKNVYKIKLIQRAIVRALEETGGLA